MVIRSMNSLFRRHGRVLFGIVTIFIIISFVGFFTPGFMSLFSGRAGSENAGMVFGKKITRSELARQTDYTMISMSVQFGMDPRNPAMRNMAANQAFDAICLKRAADDMGIKVSDYEVADFIRGLPFFKGEKGFSMEKYEAYVKNVLNPSGFKKVDMDNAVREQLVAEKLFNLLSAEVIVTPDEVKNYYKMAQEKFDVRVARFNAENFKKLVKIDQKDLESFFNANPDSYKTQPKFKILYIRFDYSEYAKTAESKITEALVKDYYEKKKKEFTSKDGKTTPLSEASKKIRTELLLEYEKELAVKAAKTAAVELYTKIEDADKNKELAFKAYAKEKNINVGQTGWFSADAGQISELGEGVQLIKAVLIAGANQSVTDAVPGEKGVYVAFIKDVEDARPAKLEEVKDRVTLNLTAIKAMSMAREKAKELAAKFAESKEKRKLIADLKNTVNFEKVDTFTAMVPPLGNDGQLIAKLSENTPAGTASTAFDTINGAILVFVDKRALPKDEDFEKQKLAVEDIYRKKKENAAVENFSIWLRRNTVTYADK